MRQHQDVLEELLHLLGALLRLLKLSEVGGERASAFLDEVHPHELYEVVLKEALPRRLAVFIEEVEEHIPNRVEIWLHALPVDWHYVALLGHASRLYDQHKGV